MNNNKYYIEIEHIIKRNEINKKTRKYEENIDILNNYWNIGRLLVEAQGGESRAKYGNGLIKEWSKDYTEKYGKGYDSSNLKRFRQFYNIFLKGGPVGHQLTWTHIRYILPIKDENKRNYYINLCIEHNLSKRELIKEIKSNSYERLIDKPDKIEIITPKTNLTLTSGIKNPIIFYLHDNEVIENEHDLEMLFISQLQSVFRQLGNGYALIGNQYKFSLGRKDYYIDLLLFNIELNCYVVIDLKVRELRKEDKGQIKFYMDYINNYIKKSSQNRTLGILITKEQDTFIATFVSDKEITSVTYKVK